MPARPLIGIALGLRGCSVVQTLSNPEALTVLIGGRPVGTVAVRERYPRKLFGSFSPNAAFQPYRRTFEAAVELARQFDATSVDAPCDDMLWDRLMNAYAEINALGPVFAELPVPIEEFAVQSDWSVEVTFEAPLA